MGVWDMPQLTIVVLPISVHRHAMFNCSSPGIFQIHWFLWAFSAIRGRGWVYQLWGCVKVSVDVIVRPAVVVLSFHLYLVQAVRLVKDVFSEVPQVHFKIPLLWHAKEGGSGDSGGDPTSTQRRR